MAQVNIKQPFGYGEYSVNVPEEGQIFRAKNDVVGSAVYKIQGGKLITLKDTALRGQLGIPENQQVGVQGFQKAGIDFNSLPQFDVDPALFQRIGIGIDTNPNQPVSLFTGVSPASSSEKITLAPDPLNPNAQGKPVSSTGRNISPLSPEGQPSKTSSFDSIQKGILDVVQSLSRLSQERGVALTPEFQKAFGDSPGAATFQKIPSVSQTLPQPKGTELQTQELSTQVPPTTPAPSATPAPEALRMYEALASAAGIKKSQEGVEAAQQNLINELKGHTSNTALYESELKRRGITEEQGIVSDLNKRILEKNKFIRDIVKDIKVQGAYHGMTEAQFERIAAAETQPQEEMLRDLLEERNFTQQEIDRHIADVKDFVDMNIKDEAIRLKAFELDVQNKEGRLKDVKDEIATVYKSAIEERKQVLSYGDKVAEAGGSQDDVKNVLDSKSSEDALEKASTFLKNQGKQQVLGLVTKYPDAGILPTDTLSQATAKVIQSPTYKANLAKTEASTQRLQISVQQAAQPLSTNALDIAAQTYLSTGNLPALGFQAGQRGAILNRAAELAKQQGLSGKAIVAQRAQVKADTSALQQLQRQKSTAQAFESKALQQIQLVLNASKNTPRTQFPIINKPLLNAERVVLGDKNAQLLLNSLITFTTEYAKIMTGSTGSVSASTDSARKEAAQLVSDSLNQGTLEATINQMKQEMRFTLEGYNSSIQEINTRLSGGRIEGEVGERIRVKDKKSGQTGTIPQNEFDASLYDKL